jgi:hypothetical protein
VLVATALLVELVYIYIVSAGRFTEFPLSLNFLDDLAEGFRHGHLHLIVEPPASLLRMADPRDPANRGLWYWDASLFNGHYYLYWGPVPALMLTVVKILLRIKTQMGDQHVVFWLATIQLTAGTLLVERISRRLFDRAPLALEVAAILAVGFANPTPYNLARPAVYEAAIVGGQAFLLLGLVGAFDAVWSDTVRRRALAAAGACWAAAIGCRTSVAPTVALLATVTLVGAVVPRPDRLRRLLRVALWLGTPLTLGVGALLLYNRLRFDAWLDFGLKHQLSWIDLRVGPRFINTNLYAYFRRPPFFSCRFPFAYAIQDIGVRAFPDGYKFPENYFVYEPVAGFLPTAPWCWFAPLALVGAALSVWRERTFSPRSWTVASLLVVVSALVPDLVLGTATNRYLGDVVGGVVLLGAAGAFFAHEWLRRWRVRWLVAAVALLLAAATTVEGLGLGMKGQYGYFEYWSPHLYQRLARKLSVCRGPLPPEPK